MDRGRLFRKSGIIYGCIGVLTVSLNVAAWNSSAFSDWYIAHIFPIWVGTYGRATGVLPFSVGEWLIAAGLGLVALVLASGVVWLCLGAAAFCRSALRHCPAFAKSGLDGSGEGCGSRKPGKWALRYRKFSRCLYGFFAWTLLMVCLLMTLNCFILYHASTFSEAYFGGDEGEYALEELMEVYNMVAGECNRLSGMMERDESGMVLYTGGRAKEESLADMADMAREMMGRLGETYPQLAGYYPRPKPLLSSDFMCQQHMQGYYFPFSMEANYNDVMHILNIPSTMCHELAHLRGYIYEDEANFIGYLACVQSEDAFFRYAGYLSVLNYLNNDLYKVRKEDEAGYAAAAEAIQPIAVDDQIWVDNVFVVQEEWDRINGKALIDTEVVDKAADVFIDTNLKVNGIADGAASYSRVVRLLLQYYRRHPAEASVLR